MSRLEKLAEDFHTCVTSEEVAFSLKYDYDVVDVIRSYWILKRKVIIMRQPFE